MPLWTRVSYEGRECFGTVAEDSIALYTGNMFDNPQPTGRSIPRSAAKLLTPTMASKMIGLVDNYHALGRQARSSGADGAPLLSEGRHFVSRR